MTLNPMNYLKNQVRMPHANFKTLENTETVLSIACFEAISTVARFFVLIILTTEPNSGLNIHKEVDGRDMCDWVK